MESYEKYKQLLNRGQYTDAVREAEAAYLRGRPTDPFWLTRQAAALVKAGRGEQALVIARQAFALAPEDPYCLLAMAEAHAARQDPEQAAPFYEEAAREPKLATYARKRLLNCLLALKAYERMRLLLAGWQMEEVDRLEWDARLARLQGHADQAAAACRRRLELRPDDPATIWELTELEIEMEGLDAVVARMGRLAKIPSRPTIYKEIYASLCRRAGRNDAALAQYEKLARQGPDPRIQRKEAFVLAKSGREREAIPIMEELLRRQPGDVYLHSAYQAACRRAGRLAGALDFYQELIRLHPEHKTLYGRLHRIRKALGEERP